MTTRLAAPLVLLLTLALGASGCVRHVVHHNPHGNHTIKHVTVLENEHTDKKIVVLHRRPRAPRVCWKHARHWHCRR
jgi:hypothetical protein